MDPNAPQSTPPTDESTTSTPIDDGALSSMQRRLEGKPMLIYGTLIAGALALLLLLMVVWLSTRENSSQVKLCLDVSVANAQTAILDGGVRRADVLIDAEQPMQGLTAIQLELEDGECRKLPEGADNRDALLQVLGLIELYNQEGEGNIRVEYQRETVPANLLITSTAIPTLTTPTEQASPLPASPVPVSTATSTPTPSPSPTPIPTATASPTTTMHPTIAPTAIPTTPPTESASATP